ncbi:periplasmic heavy metal sensor [Novosphingobium sp.]|uniref:periplasmic heavy metal sensor n=1 Tax=Novosphingobium sp. TaxID=1874826 RepID=UPI002B461168|nr:periplasmic heavy metal sensor [Novosphingobium sp.]HKR93228.1 periplasmic heavy metal sensor [Novosphingobium sp.]
MIERLRFVLMLLFAFGAAIGGVLIGRAWIMPPVPAESELHEVLHKDLQLDDFQKQQIEQIERKYALRRQSLELELRSDNARLASAIETEHGYGPLVASAVDASHKAMGELQKITLEHIFAMRSVLRPDQAARFDTAVVKALTVKPR